MISVLLATLAILPTGLSRAAVGAPPVSEYSRAGVCAGETGFPLKLGSATPFCPPYRNLALFIAAHPDDETLGMAGAIREAVLAGRSVVIELMTHGTESRARTLICARLPGKCPRSREAFGDARVREFLDAMGRLGVQAVRVHDDRDGSLKMEQVSERIGFWKRNAGPGLSVAGPAGHEDQTFHPDHGAVSDAIVASSVNDSMRAMVYRFRSARSTRSSLPERVSLSEPVCRAKRDALQAYQLWSPEEGRYSVGTYSTPELFREAAADCAEYRISAGASEVYRFRVKADASYRCYGGYGGDEPKDPLAHESCDNRDYREKFIDQEITIRIRREETPDGPELVGDWSAKFPFKGRKFEFALTLFKVQEKKGVSYTLRAVASDDGENRSASSTLSVPSPGALNPVTIQHHSVGEPEIAISFAFAPVERK
jgi:LmbE family N-acetylglucosaminyl deacetylase